jgi:hypothetical protein
MELRSSDVRMVAYRNRKQRSALRKRAFPEISDQIQTKMKKWASESFLDSATFGRAKESEEFKVAQEQLIACRRILPGLDQTEVAIETVSGR